MGLDGADAMFGAEKDAAYQNGEGGVPVFHPDIRHRAEGAADARIVDHAVEPAEGVGGPGYGGGDVVLATDICRQESHWCVRAVAAGPGLDSGDTRVPVEVGDDHRPAGVEQPLHRGAADAAGATGHHCASGFAHTRSPGTHVIR